MLDVRYSTQFKRDFKACVKRRCNMGFCKKSLIGYEFQRHCLQRIEITI